jgi:hypothetical protein
MAERDELPPNVQAAVDRSLLAGVIFEDVREQLAGAMRRAFRVGGERATRALVDGTLARVLGEFGIGGRG